MHNGDKTPVVCCLGRYGDICNALPIAYEIHRTTGIRPKFVVSREFWTILDGVGYIQPIVWDLPYSELPRAINRLEGKHEIICQSYMHKDDRRLTDSYQKESWRVAGWLERFGTIPLVFDKRDKGREDELNSTWLKGISGKKVLVATQSVSSPYAAQDELINELRGAGAHVVDMRSVKAHRIYDILGLMDNADLLVTVDTMHMHLGRASKIPMICIINNGWFGSIPPDNCIKSFRYSEVSTEKIVSAAKQFLYV